MQQFLITTRSRYLIIFINTKSVLCSHDIFYSVYSLLAALLASPLVAVLIAQEHLAAPQVVALQAPRHQVLAHPDAHHPAVLHQVHPAAPRQVQSA
jgi:hypothetical protein